MDEMEVNARLTLRDEKSEVTRRRITGAARLLFRTRGYGATTLQAIAAEAGVATQTVYAVFGSKAGLLRALRDALVVQPEAEALYREALRAESADEKLGLFARSIARRWEAGGDIVRVHIEAASTDPAIRQEVAAVLERRLTGIRGLVATLIGELRPGVGDPAAIVDALTMPEVHAELTGLHGWTSDEYEAWLARSLRSQLLAE
jgi:AcrR family transcriptional regulator